MDKNRFIMRINWICFFYCKKRNTYKNKIDIFCLGQILFYADLHPPACCPGGDLQLQRWLVMSRRIKPPGNMLLSDCPPVLHIHSRTAWIYLPFPLKRPSHQFLPPPCLSVLLDEDLSGDGWLQLVKTDTLSTVLGHKLDHKCCVNFNIIWYIA